ncbi:HD domain-containing protein [Tessaracoccus caeni]|uniref:hypothetical protein n=1 Tax=Tessaracoccus caeni TaxID=3031239 RepID=UPI0023D9DCB9|nr:hypothetical protein [Tessaracoccus caeni]MDF1489393.1 hypothetical protein [Tessaracoccus caeni]
MAAPQDHSLLTVDIRCPVHGPIDLTDEMPTRTKIIRELVLSSQVQRLRRIKQLGFASFEFSGADHSRFSHALGTMHVMRMILDSSSMNKKYLDQLASKIDIKGRSRRKYARQHMLVAALLQDCGELPYAFATSSLIKPDDDVLGAVKALTGEDATNWPTKAVFTVACIERLGDVLKDMDSRILSYLITGSLWKERIHGLEPAMHLLNGVLDADRIDYVKRDAHHTGHGHLDIKAIVASIRDVDDKGVICSDPASVASLLALRAHLYSTVYYSAPNRFRVMLVKELLHAIDAAGGDIRKDVFGDSGLVFTSAGLLQLDDLEIEKFVAKARISSCKHRLSERAEIALSVLSGESNNYKEFWLSTEDDSPNGEEVSLPPRAFGEYFQQTRLADGIGVRIRTESAGEIIDKDLGEMNGPYSRVLKDSKSQLPMRGDVLVYMPENGTISSDYRRALKEGWLGAGIKAGLVAKGSVREVDTRAFDGFAGPAIFISYCHADLPLVAAITDELYRRRRRYVLLAGAFQGIGGTPGYNSRELARQGEACLMITSTAYRDRVRDDPMGAIVSELGEVVKLKAERRTYPVVAISACEFVEMNNFPWRLFGLEQTPFFGRPLKPGDIQNIEQAVGEAIKKIDDELGWTGA